MKKNIIAYHGTNNDFNEFCFVGQKLTSMGLGYYFSPDKKKAEQYGKIVKKYRLSGNFFDWDNIGDDFKKIIFPILMDTAGKEIMAGYSSEKSKIFSNDKNGKNEAMKFYKEKKEETKHRHHDRSKAKVQFEEDHYKITWRDAENLNGANNQMIMNLCQNFIHEIVAQLGYDGAFYLSEIVVYNKECIKEITIRNNHEHDI